MASNSRAYSVDRDQSSSPPPKMPESLLYAGRRLARCNPTPPPSSSAAEEGYAVINGAQQVGSGNRPLERSLLRLLTQQKGSRIRSSRMSVSTSEEEYDKGSFDESRADVMRIENVAAVELQGQQRGRGGVSPGINFTLNVDMPRAEPVEQARHDDSGSTNRVDMVEKRVEAETSANNLEHERSRPPYDIYKETSDHERPAQSEETTLAASGENKKEEEDPRNCSHVAQRNQDPAYHAFMHSGGGPMHHQMPNMHSQMQHPYYSHPSHMQPQHPYPNSYHPQPPPPPPQAQPQNQAPAPVPAADPRDDKSEASEESSEDLNKRIDARLQAIEAHRNAKAEKRKARKNQAVAEYIQTTQAAAMKDQQEKANKEEEDKKRKQENCEYIEKRLAEENAKAKQEGLEQLRNANNIIPVNPHSGRTTLVGRRRVRA